MRYLLCSLASLFFITSLNAIEPIKYDFKACYENSKKSFIKIRGLDAVAVAGNRALLYSKRYLRGYIKRDPFLGLYIFRVKKNLNPVKFFEFNKIKKTVAVINRKNYNLNSILSDQVGLSIMGRLKKPVVKNSLVESVCCRAYALSVGKNRFIDSDYILRFLRSKKIYYADLGMGFMKKDKKIYVKDKNPFFKGNCLKIGDEILSIDGKRFKKLSNLLKYTLFRKIGKKVKVIFKRGGRVYHCKIRTKRLKVGGLLGGSYLEYIGLYIGYDLKVKKVLKNSIAYRLGLKKGDKLMKIQDVYIYKYKDIKYALSKIRSKIVYMLFSRNDFQFFVHFRR